MTPLQVQFMLLKALEMLLEPPGICLQTPAPKITALVMQRHQFKLEYFLSVNSCYKVFVGIPGIKSNILGTKQHWIYSLHCFRDLQINFTTLYKCLSVQSFSN